MSTRRRVKWHTTPPSPKIVNLPARHFTRRRKTRTTRNKQPATTTAEIIETYNYKGKLGSLFGVEKEFSRTPVEVEEVTEDDADGGGDGGRLAEERWRFQAEMLQAECDFLRKERKLALKKLEKNRVRIEDCSILTCKSQNKSTDYRSFINNSVASSASTSNRINFSDHLSFSNRFSNQAMDPLVSKEAGYKCSGRCKLLVRRMAEQVRADTEQWSQMQVMLGQLRQEMEQLHTSKDFWETQALVSNKEIQSLMIDVEEWRNKAVGYETKANKLQTEANRVKSELEKLKKDQAKEVESTPKKAMVSLGKQIEREAKIGLSCRMKGPCDAIVSGRHEKVDQSKKESRPLSLGKQLAREKQILFPRMKENPLNNNEILSDGRRKLCNLVRSPFKDVGNSSSSSMGIEK